MDNFDFDLHSIEVSRDRFSTRPPQSCPNVLYDDVYLTYLLRDGYLMSWAAVACASAIINPSISSFEILVIELLSRKI